jgi:hypothetical protein
VLPWDAAARSLLPPRAEAVEAVLVADESGEGGEDDEDEEVEDGGGGGEEEDGDEAHVMAAADVDSIARAWLQARRSQLLALLSGIKSLLRSETASERSSILAQLLLLRAFDFDAAAQNAGAPPEPLPRVSGPSSIAEFARAWLTLHAQPFFSGIAVERLDAELRSAVARTASDVGAAIASVSLLLSLLRAGGNSGDFVAPLLASSIGALARGMVLARES